RQVLILKGKQNIYKREYGETISLEALSPILVSLIDFLKDAREDTIQFMNIINYKIGYATDIAHDLLFIFITDLTDEDENIEEQLEIIKYEFFTRYESYLNQEVDASYFTGFDEVVDEIFKELRPKIALIGFSGVGKTTITKLIRAEDIPMRHVPTITGDVATIKIGHVNLYLWDFAGQEKYSFVWNKFIKGADAVILILDSTAKNVKESKFFLELVKKEEPHAKISVVANKQDLPDALPPEEIEQMLGVKTHGLIAIDPESREKMLYIIVDTLKIRSLVAPFVAPLLQRDNLVAEAEAAIMAGNIALAADKFDQIAQLSMILEEPELATHFSTQAQLLRSKLQEMQKLTTIPEKGEASPEEVKEAGEPEKVVDEKAPSEEELLKKKEEEERLKREEEERRRKEEELLKKKEEKIEEKPKKVKPPLVEGPPPIIDLKKVSSKPAVESASNPIASATEDKKEPSEPEISTEGLTKEELQSKIENVDYKINVLISQFSKGEITEQVFQKVLDKLEKEKEIYKTQLDEIT
ncbi:MAG: ADP-ribosylation factor-like protein, partial [Candidatus Helarchaeales archaeon]